jgi:hypothetical protein
MKTLHPSEEETADESDDAPSEDVSFSENEELADREEPEEEEGEGREEEPYDEGKKTEEDADESDELEESDDSASLDDELSDEELVNELDDPEHVPNAKPGEPRTTSLSSKPQLTEAVTQLSFTVPGARRSMRSILAFGDELDPANGAPTPSSTSSRMTPNASRRRRSSFVLESERDDAR